ncbi:hypothetical protein CF651_30905 [Paenibacillus rigui]|uniref:DUF6933 domain-containing protein n=2 Tax=Paenibacillus rigui TaxID=554312 RepID=A0A229UGD4_9BACL|nr:hypothetical protein CF651_30905 [Paenibacillus rigui]
MGGHNLFLVKSCLDIGEHYIKVNQYKNLKEILQLELRDYLSSEDIEERLISAYMDCCKEIIVSNTNNRSVLGTLNEIMLIMNAVEKKNDFANNIERNKWNNQIIYKPIDYEKPIDVFKKALVKHL